MSLFLHRFIWTIIIPMVLFICFLTICTWNTIYRLLSKILKVFSEGFFTNSTHCLETGTPNKSSLFLHVLYLAFSKTKPDIQNQHSDFRGIYFFDNSTHEGFFNHFPGNFTWKNIFINIQSTYFYYIYVSSLLEKFQWLL